MSPVATEIDAAGGGGNPTPGDTLNNTGKLHHVRGR
jgi:hypothetical protein